jgi:putative ABC transport system permease protein
MLHRWIIRAAGRLVPRDGRAEWRAEWDAELLHRERQDRRWNRPGALTRRALGAIRDAWTLQIGTWHSARFFARHWRLTATALLSLTMAITVTIVGLALGDALLRRPPAVRDAHTVRSLYLRTPDDEFGSVSFEEFEYYRKNTRSFADITAYPFSITSLGFRSGAYVDQVIGAQVADNYFQVLGIAPTQGTLAFREGQGDVVVIAERLWHRLGRPGPGTVVRINDHPVAIAGIVPSSFQGMLFVWSADLWMPFRTAQTVIGQSATRLTDPSQRWLHMVGRLAPSATEVAANAEARVLSNGWSSLHRASGRREEAFVTATTVTPASDREWVTLLLGTLVAAVLMMLAVACANVTNLLLGLSIARRYEFLVRTAVGASPRHLVVPVLRESVALALAAGTLGYAAAYEVLTRLATTRLKVQQFVTWAGLDARPGVVVTLVIIGLVVLCGLLIGVAPARRAARDGLVAGVNQASTARHTPARFRGALVVVQMVAATLVLAALTVSVSSAMRLRNAALGFSARSLAFTGIDVRRTGYDEHTGPLFYERVRQRIAALPGVEAVSLADGPPFGNGWGRDTISPANGGRAVGRPREVRISAVDQRYFATMGIAIRAGRAFDDHDTLGAPEVVIVNETLARQHWPDANAIGKRLRIDRGNRLVTVVGVAADGKYDDVGEAQGPFMYYALAQHYQNDIVAIARTSPSGPAPQAIARALMEMESHLALGGLGVMSLDDLLSLPLLFSRMVVWVAATVSVMTLILAVAGLYTSVFYSVQLRRQEFGIRMVLGAGARQVYRLALGTMGWAAGSGAIIGVAVASGLLPLVASMFYGIRPIEPLLLVVVAAAGVVIVLGTTLIVVRPITRMANLLTAVR